MSASHLNNPFPMKAVFRNCFMINFAVEPDVMQRLLPTPLQPDLYANKAFVDVAVVDMEQMRPAFLPRGFGINYNQVVYRTAVRCNGERGVYFLRSDADNGLISKAGNWMTFFQFHHSRMQWQRQEGCFQFDLMAQPGQHADIHARFDISSPSRQMPENSCFPSLAEAQAFLVELYSAYSPDARGISRVRIQRTPWDIQVVQDTRGIYEFMQGSEMFPEGTATLDSVFYVRDLSYLWSPTERLSSSHTP